MRNGRLYWSGYLMFEIRLCLIGQRDGGTNYITGRQVGASCNRNHEIIAERIHKALMNFISHRFVQAIFKASLKKHPSSGLKLIILPYSIFVYIYPKHALTIRTSSLHTTWHTSRST